MWFFLLVQGFMGKLSFSLTSFAMHFFVDPRRSVRLHEANIDNGANAKITVIPA